MSEKIGNPYDMDSSSFDAETYLEKLLKVNNSQLSIASIFLLITCNLLLFRIAPLNK